MSGYPGGMSKQTRNQLWFHQHSVNMPDTVVNDFVTWVGDNKPVRDWHWTRRLSTQSINLLWSEFARQI